MPKSRVVSRSPVDGQEPGRQAADEFQGAGGAERLVFPDVADLDAPAASVAAIGLDEFGQVSGRNDDVLEAEVLQLTQDDLDDRVVADGDEGLGERRGERPQSSALPARQDHGLPFDGLNPSRGLRRVRNNPLLEILYIIARERSLRSDSRLEAHMNNEGLVSVILPFYNGRAYIKEALDSILAQTYANFEVILVDDGSPDPAQTAYLKDLAASYRDDRLKYFYKENRGLSVARNFAYAQSRGSYIAFIDQDDLWRPEKLAAQMEVFRGNPGVEFIFSNGETFGESSRQLRRRRSIRDGLIRDSYSQMLRGNVVPALTAIFTRALVEKVGLSNPRYAMCPDYEYFLRMSERTDFYFVDKPLALCRLS